MPSFNLLKLRRINILRNFGVLRQPCILRLSKQTLFQITLLLHITPDLGVDRYFITNLSWRFWINLGIITIINFVDESDLSGSFRVNLGWHLFVVIVRSNLSRSLKLRCTLIEGITLKCLQIFKRLRCTNHYPKF